MASGSSRAWGRSWAATICGGAAAILLFELGLRTFYGETPSGRFTVVRQYAEGLSIANYVSDDPKGYSWRVTGNPPIEGAPVVLIVGDSYIVARQVRDAETMGAIIERWSREEGRPINVRQYGIPGGSAPAYAAAASALIARWKPAWVVVVLPTNDLTDEALNKAPLWRMRIGPGDAVTTYRVSDPPPPSAYTFPGIIEYLKLHSRLADLLELRWSRLRRPHPPPPPRGARIEDDPRVAKVPRASIALLSREYGNRLLIMHLPEVSIRFSQMITPQEVRLEQACREAGIPYLSARNVLIRARERFVLSRGFWNTTPGDGHLNETGHRLVAGVLWELLDNSRRSAREQVLPTSTSARTDALGTSGSR